MDNATLLGDVGTNGQTNLVTDFTSNTPQIATRGGSAWKPEPPKEKPWLQEKLDRQGEWFKELFPWNKPKGLTEQETYDRDRARELEIRREQTEFESGKYQRELDAMRKAGINPNLIYGGGGGGGGSPETKERRQEQKQKDNSLQTMLMLARILLML